MSRLSFVTGLALGYVLGAKAGRERYEQIRRASGALASSAPMHQVGRAAVQAGREAGGMVGHRLGERLPESVVRRLPERYARTVEDSRRTGNDRYNGGL